MTETTHTPEVLLKCWAYKSVQVHATANQKIQVKCINEFWVILEISNTQIAQYAATCAPQQNLLPLRPAIYIHPHLTIKLGQIWLLESSLYVQGSAMPGDDSDISFDSIGFWMRHMSRQCLGKTRIDSLVHTYRIAKWPVFQLR
jgi:hypothetical protein